MNHYILFWTVSWALLFRRMSWALCTMLSDVRANLPPRSNMVCVCMGVHFSTPSLFNKTRVSKVHLCPPNIVMMTCLFYEKIKMNSGLSIKQNLYSNMEEKNYFLCHHHYTGASVVTVMDNSSKIVAPT